MQATVAPHSKRWSARFVIDLFRDAAEASQFNRHSTLGNVATVQNNNNNNDSGNENSRKYLFSWHS